jgi:hypothetical protein
MGQPSIDLGALRTLSTSALADAIVGSTPRQDLTPPVARNGASNLNEAHHLNGSALSMRHLHDTEGLQARASPDGWSEADRRNLCELVLKLSPGSDKSAWQVGPSPLEVHCSQCACMHALCLWVAVFAPSARATTSSAARGACGTRRTQVRLARTSFLSCMCVLGGVGADEPHPSLATAPATSKKKQPQRAPMVGAKGPCASSGSSCSQGQLGSRQERLPAVPLLSDHSCACCCE